MYITDKEVFVKRIEATVKQILGINVSCRLDEHDGCIRVIIREYVDDIIENIIATFTLSRMPGCCGIVVSNGVAISPKYQHKGLGNALHKIRLDMIKHLGYSCVICTDITGNVPQEKLLYANGWTRVNSFVNKRTDNDVSVFIINLNEGKILSWLNRLNFRRWPMWNYCITKAHGKTWSEGCSSK